MQTKSIAEITATIKIFADERGWYNNDPRELITLLLVELGELSEHFARKTAFVSFPPDKQKEVEYELVDVMVYLFRFAQKAGVDLEKAFAEKWPKLEEKFPLGKDVEQAHDEYRHTGKNKLYA